MREIPVENADVRILHPHTRGVCNISMSHICITMAIDPSIVVRLHGKSHMAVRRREWPIYIWLALIFLRCS